MADKQSCCLVVMAKAPRAGEVKTRLIPLLGRIGATKAYQQLLNDTLNILSASGEFTRYLSCAPDTRHAGFRRFRSCHQWTLHRQPRGDLGARMSQIFSRLLRQYDAVILVGSDLVNIDSDQVDWGFDALAKGADLVLGRTVDGGYGMIGMQRLHAGLFTGMPWSSNRVADITLTRARRMGLNSRVLHGLQDIDSPADYVRWCVGRLARGSTVSRNGKP